MTEYIGTHTETITQSYFVEALQGAKHPSNYLDRFPNVIYNTSPDAILYKLIYTLIGPSGVASLKRGYFEARLKFEEMGLEFSELERFYANPMGFGRLATETYAEDTTGLLNNDIWSKVKAQDQAYKNRVLDFLHAARLGGTPQGIRYAAKSALGQDVDVVEGYQYLFDQNSDQMLSLDSMVPASPTGTYSTEAFVISPNAEISKSVVQTISFNPIPDQGSFVIKYGPYQTSEISITNFEQSYSIDSAIGENYIYTYTTSTEHLIPVGANVTIEGASLGTYNGNFTVIATTNITFSVIGSESYPDIPEFELGKVTAELSKSVASRIRDELIKIPTIKENVKVTGNLEDGFKIQFNNELANQLDIGILTVDASLLNTLNDSNELTPCSAIVTSSSGVISPNNEISGFAPEVKHALFEAVGQIKPVASYPVLLNGTSRWNHLTLDPAISPVTSSSFYKKVVRHVTGKSDVNWPSDSKNSLYWIKRNQEVEAPSVNNDYKESYQNFHKVNLVKAYDQNDPSTSAENYHIGAFTDNFAKAFSFFQKYNQSQYTSTKFSPDLGVADHTKPRTATSAHAANTSLIDSIYAPEYFNLQNVIKKPVNDLFWASKQKQSGYDYLEIDLGQTRAVNFLSFEIIKAPTDIEIEYDTLDYGSTKNWKSVVPEMLPNSTNPYTFTKSVSYSAADVNSPWQYLTYAFRNENDDLIYARYVRIKFTRKSTGSLYQADFLKTAWPICIKNLRIGRNV